MEIKVITGIVLLVAGGLIVGWNLKSTWGALGSGMMVGGALLAS